MRTYVCEIFVNEYYYLHIINIINYKLRENII